MTRPSSRLAAAGAFALALAALAAPSYWAVHSWFSPWDDEGSMLASLRMLADGGAPYTGFYSNYGLTWLELFGGLFALAGRPLTHDAGRMVVLVVWLSASAVMGVAVRRLTGSLVLGLLALALTHGLLHALVYDPMHPGGLTSLGLVFAVAALAFLPDRPRAAAAALGALVAALALTKINVGGLLALPLLYALALSLRRSTATVAGAALLVALPVVLISPELGQGWARVFAALASLGMLAVALATFDRRDLAAPPFAWLAAGAAAVAGVVLGVAVVLGTTPRGLLDGIVLVALDQRRAYTSPLLVSPWLVAGGALGVAGAALVRLRGVGTGVRWGAGRLLAGACLVLLVSHQVPLGFAGESTHVAMALAVPLVWVAALPGGLAPGVDPFARVVLCAAAICELLQAYPVAGVQLPEGMVMLVPVAALCVADGLAELRAALAPATQLRAVQGLGAAALAGAVVAFVVAPGIEEHRLYDRNVALPFEAAADVRLPRGQARDLERVVASVHANCDALVTLPGLSSLNLWSGLPLPPGNRVYAHWWRLIEHRDQRKVVAWLRSAPRPCAVRNDDVIGFWSRGRALPENAPLLRYLDGELAPLERFGSYQVLTRQR